MADFTQPLSYDIKQACELLGVRKTKLYELLSSGGLKGKKIGTKTIILADDLHSFLENLEDYPTKKEGSNND